MARRKAAKARRARSFRCARCYRLFQSRKALKVHSRQHLKALREITMLEKGETPEFSKLGQEFRGKNKIIVA